MRNALDHINEDYQRNSVQYRDDPSFMETLGATFSYKYDPVKDFIAQETRFPNVAEEGFVAKNHIPKGYEPFYSTLLKATNEDHMGFLLDQIDRSSETRQILADSGLGASLAAELFDPVNLLAIPFAGGATFMGRFLAGGAGVAGVVAAQEAIRHPFDPLSTTSEVALNIGSSFMLGGALSGVVGIPAARRAGAIQSASKEIDRLRAALDPDVDTFDAKIAENIFTDTWLYKSVTTPMKRVLQSEVIPNDRKLDMLGIANDAGVLLAGNKKGKVLEPSVFQLAKLNEGEFALTYDALLKDWGDATGKGVANPMDYLRNRKDFETWVEVVDQKAMQGLKAADEYEQRAMDSLNSFYSTWEKRLRDQGMIGDIPSFKRSIEYKNGIIDEAKVELSAAKSLYAKSRLTEKITRLTDEISELEANIKDAQDGPPIKPANEDVFRPRYWNQDYILKNRERLEQVLSDWYTGNPYIYRKEKGKWVRTKLSTDPKHIQERASQTVNDILGLGDEADSFGSGMSAHFMHRKLDIPNKLVLDFIHTNPVAVMKSYTSRISPRYEFAKKFGGRSIDDIVDDMFIETMENGATVEQAHAAARDVRAMHEIVTRTVHRDPDHWSHKTARYMRTGAILNYLGAAGFSTITEPAKIMMEHGIGPTMRGLFTVLDNNQLKLGAKEGRISGEALETLQGSTILRLVDDVSMNPLRGDLLDKATDASMLLNLLGPITRVLKDFDAMMRVHTLIDYSVRLTQGKASKMETDYLARYGIDAETALKVSEMPWNKGDSGLYLANTEAWAKLDFKETFADVGSTYRHSTRRIDKMSEKELLESFGDKFYFDRVITDPKIVRDVLAREGYPDGLGFSMHFGDGMPNTVYMDFEATKGMYRRLRDNNKSLGEIRDGLESVRSQIGEEAYAHKSKLLDNIDLIDDEDAFVRFVFLHELHHTTTPRQAGESLLQYESRIDDLAFEYIKTERKEGLRLAAEKEHDLRVKSREDTVTKFRSALSSGILNTILMGTPADKPIITQGVAFIPMRVASKFGMKEDPKYKGYARIENGLLGLPFQFYSYTLAALNKITVAHAQGQLKNQILGTMIAMGLGYTLLQIKTPDFVEMSFQDKFARAFDYSGVAALHSDMFYTAMATSLAFGGPNLTGGLLQPRFPEKKDIGGGIAGLAGAGPSYTYDVAGGLYDLMTGNVSDGSKELIRDLPFARLWFLKSLTNRMSNALSDKLEDDGGFGRF